MTRFPTPGGWVHRAGSMKGHDIPAQVGPAQEGLEAMTPKRDAAAVRRIITLIEKRERELAELNRDLVPHANRLCFANGLRVPLRGPALKQLAFAS